MATITIPRTAFFDFWFVHLKGQPKSYTHTEKFLKFVLTLQPEFSLNLPLQMDTKARLEHELYILSCRMAKIWRDCYRSKARFQKSRFLLNKTPLVFLNEKKDCPRKSKSSDAQLGILDQAVEILQEEGLKIEAKLLKGWLNQLSK